MNSENRKRRCSNCHKSEITRSPSWIWNREYDFTLFDKNIKDVTEAVPDVKLNVVLDLNPPSWWMTLKDIMKEVRRLKTKMASPRGVEPLLTG